MKTSRLSKTFGLRISQLDLRNLTKDEIGNVCQLLLSHKLLLFTGQNLTKFEFAALCKKLGEIVDYPFAPRKNGLSKIQHIKYENIAQSRFSVLWHSDSSYLAEPPDSTLLFPIRIPNKGGETDFFNAVEAFDSLPRIIKEQSRHYTITNTSNKDVHLDRSSYLGDEKGLYSSNRVLSKVMSFTKKHPITGEIALMVNEEHTACINELEVEESNKVLEYLKEHIASSVQAYRLKWEKGMLAFWDNRVIQHKAVCQNGEGQKEMLRALLNLK